MRFFTGLRAGILVANRTGQLWLQTDILDVVRGVGIICGPDHSVVVVEDEFILQAVPERALIERHVALWQIETSVGCRIDCYKHRQWHCLLQRMHPYFQH